MVTIVTLKKFIIIASDIFDIVVAQKLFNEKKRKRKVRIIIILMDNFLYCCAIIFASQNIIF